MLVPASRSISRSSSMKGTPRCAASCAPSVDLPAPRRADQRDALFPALLVAQAEAARQQRIGLVELGIVQARQQALHPAHRRARRVLQQLEDRDVERAGCGFQRVDGDIALAAFHVRQEALGQARVRRRAACASCLAAPARHARAHPARPGWRRASLSVMICMLSWLSYVEDLHCGGIAVYFLSTPCQAVYCICETQMKSENPRRHHDQHRRLRGPGDPDGLRGPRGRHRGLPDGRPGHQRLR